MSNSFGSGVSLDALESQQRNGSGWFFWIAGLSMITAILQISGSDINFVVGLGVTLIIAAIAAASDQNVGPEAAIVIKAIAIGFCALVSAFFAGLGFFARRGHVWAFVVGMLLYLLDGLIYLAVGLWMSVGFHAFVLIYLFNGCKAARALGKAPAPATYEQVYPAEIEPQQG